MDEIDIIQMLHEKQKKMKHEENKKVKEQTTQAVQEMKRVKTDLQTRKDIENPMSSYRNNRAPVFGPQKSEKTESDSERRMTHHEA